LMHIVKYNIWLFECQLVITNDVELTRFCDIYPPACDASCYLAHKLVKYPVPVNILACSRTGNGR